MCNTYVLKFGYFNSYQLENCEIISYTWHIYVKYKKKTMHWWFRVFWHTYYSIDVSSLFYNHNKRLNHDSGHNSVGDVTCIRQWLRSFVDLSTNKDRQAMEKRISNITQCKATVW